MNKLYIVMYHYTRDLVNSRYAQIKGLDVRLFKKQIEYIKSKFTVVTMEQVIASKKGEGQLPENAMLLTFDDGYIDNYINALPILSDAGIQGSFFIPGKTFTTNQLLDVNKIHYILAVTDADKLLQDLFERMNYYRGQEFDYASNEELYQQYAIGTRFDNEKINFIKRILQTELPKRVRNMIVNDLFVRNVDVSEEILSRELYMTEEQIKLMKKQGMYIGVHGYDHFWLGNMDINDMKTDITKALEVMDPFINQNQWVMNYPYGNYNEGVINFISSKGAVLGLTTEVGIANLSKDSCYELPRLDCNDFPPKTYNYRNFKVHPFVKTLFKKN